MSCDVASTIEGRKYLWYKDNNPVHIGQSYTIQNAETSHSGNYQCRTIPGEISDPARLDVIDGWVILQTPVYVYEGDALRLRCHHYPGYPEKQTIFYKDNSVIRGLTDNAEFYIENVDGNTTGKYGCRKQVYHHLLYYQHGDDVLVSVQELFTTPTIKVIPNLDFENIMTLKCETSLHPYRQNTPLRFAFYRGGRMVQGFGVSDIYEVYIVQPEDSGKYLCEVGTRDGRVRKRSAEQIIDIEDLFSDPIIVEMNNVILEGDPMTLTCEATLYINPTQVQFSFYRDGRTVQEFSSSNIYQVQSAHLEDSGSYSCEVKKSDSTIVRKSDEYNMRVHELFTTPTITVIPSPNFEKNIMTLKCETSLHPSSQNTPLGSAFYRGGRMVQGFGVNDIYEIVQPEDSGKYSCEVVTTDGQVRKRSAERIINIDDLFSDPIITEMNNVILEGEPMTLTCEVTLYIKPTQVQFAFYRDGQMVQEFSSSNKYEVQSAHLEDSGSYSCDVKTSISTKMRRSDEYNMRVHARPDNMGYTLQNRIRLTLSAGVFIIAALFVFYHIKWMKSMEPADGSTTQ